MTQKACSYSLHWLTSSSRLLYASVSSLRNSLSETRVLLVGQVDSSPSLGKVSSLRSKFWWPELMPFGFGLGVEVLELSAILREEVDDPVWMKWVYVWL